MTVADLQTETARATNVRFLAELDARLEELGRRLDRLVEILAVEGRPPAPKETLAAEPAAEEQTETHLAFVPTPEGYELVARPGTPPALGEVVELDGRSTRYLVVKCGPSPLPGDARTCVYLQIT